MKIKILRLKNLLQIKFMVEKSQFQIFPLKDIKFRYLCKFLNEVYQLEILHIKNHTLLA